MAMTTVTPAAPYAMPPTFEDLQERLRRETARVRVKRVCAIATGEKQAAQDLAGLHANLRALADDFAAWRARHPGVTT